MPDTGASLAARGVRRSLGGTIYDPTDPMGKLFFNILATFAEFEVDLLRTRTRGGTEAIVPLEDAVPRADPDPDLFPTAPSGWSREPTAGSR